MTRRFAEHEPGQLPGLSSHVPVNAFAMIVHVAFDGAHAAH
ncbi:MAG: hypothetical protein QOI41_657, partial [Myxococcales bacterium]|nr:hypothetical protein [Myxococcales bacterium]